MEEEIWKTYEELTPTELIYLKHGMLLYQRIINGKTYYRV